MPPEVFVKLQSEVRARKHTAFAYSVSDLSGYSGLEGPFALDLTTTESVYEKPRHHSLAERNVQDEKCSELLSAGIIVQSSPTLFAACPTMPAKKDADVQWSDRRFCIDFRRVVGNAILFSKIDLRSGFHQIPIRKEDQHKTAFWWGHSTYQFTRMPFGLLNATAKFQRVVDAELLRAGLTGCAAAFVDDVLIWSNTAKEHVAHVCAVLDALAAVNLMVHPDKFIFGAAVVEYLGHNISGYGMSPHDAKVAAIRALRAPTRLADLQAAFGLLNYYRIYCPDFSQTAQLLYSLLKKGAAYVWGEPQQPPLTRSRRN